MWYNIGEGMTLSKYDGYSILSFKLTDLPNKHAF